MQSGNKEEEYFDLVTIKQGDDIVAMLSLGDDTLSLDDDCKDDIRSGFVPKPNIALAKQFLPLII